MHTTCFVLVTTLLNVLAFRSNPRKDFSAAENEHYVFRTWNIPRSGADLPMLPYGLYNSYELPEEIVNEPKRPVDPVAHGHGLGYGHGHGLGHGHGSDDGHKHEKGIASDQNAEEPANFNINSHSESADCEDNGIKDKYTFVALIDIVFVDGCKRTCTGAIIHDNVVITAAHCFTMVRDQFAQPELSLSFVVIGTKRMFETGYEQYLPIERVVTHPRFRGWTADLALVFTFANMDSDKPGKVLPLYLEKSSVPVDSNVTVFSWGKCNSDIDSKEKDDSKNKLTYLNKIGNHKYKKKNNHPDHHYKIPDHLKPAAADKQYGHGGHSNVGTGGHQSGHGGSVGNAGHGDGGHGGGGHGGGGHGGGGQDGGGHGGGGHDNIDGGGGGHGDVGDSVIGEIEGGHVEVSGEGGGGGGNGDFGDGIIGEIEGGHVVVSGEGGHGISGDNIGEIEPVDPDDIENTVPTIVDLDSKLQIHKLQRQRINRSLPQPQRPVPKKVKVNDDRNTRRGHKVDDLVEPAVKSHIIDDKIKRSVQNHTVNNTVKPAVQSHKKSNRVEPAVQSFFDLQDYDGQNFVSLKSNSTGQDMGDEPFLEMIKKGIKKTNLTSEHIDSNVDVNKNELNLDNRRNLKDTIANLIIETTTILNRNVRYIRNDTNRKVRRQMPRVHRTDDLQYYNNWRRTIGQQHNNLSVGMFGYVNIASCKKTIERTLPPLYEIDNKHEYLCYSSEEFYITNEDSGAPVVQRDELVAVTVGGIDNEGDHIAVGMKIACFCNWIAFHLPNHDGAKLHCCHGCCIDHSKQQKGQNDDQYQITGRQSRHILRSGKKPVDKNQYYPRVKGNKSTSKTYYDPNDANHRVASSGDGQQFENQPEFKDERKGKSRNKGEIS